MDSRVLLAAWCGAVLLGAVWMLSTPAEVMRTEAPPVAAAPKPAKSGSQDFFAQVGGPAKVDKPASLSAQLDRLSATGRPEDAMRAFKMAFDCKELHADDYKFGPPSADLQSKFCGDITNLQMREMGKNLDKAVAARVPGALFAKLIFGPLGGNRQALIDMPNDPAVVEWKKTIVTELTQEVWKGGEFILLASLSDIYGKGELAEKNPVLQLAYHMAMLDIHFAKSDSPEVVKANRAKDVAKLSVDLSAGQVAEAEAIAKKIALTCCSKK